MTGREVKKQWTGFQISQTPDLWDRIEAGLQERPANTMAEKRKAKQRIPKVYASAAACLVVGVISIATYQTLNNKGLLSKSSGSMENNNSAMDMGEENLVFAEDAADDAVLDLDDGDNVDQGMNDGNAEENNGTTVQGSSGTADGESKVVSMPNYIIIDGQTYEQRKDIQTFDRKAMQKTEEIVTEVRDYLNSPLDREDYSYVLGDTVYTDGSDLKWIYCYDVYTPYQSVKEE